MTKEYTPDLFGEGDYEVTPKKLARGTDPSTSKAAAVGAPDFLGRHHRIIYSALETMVDGTFYEIAEHCALEPAAVWRRLNEMEKKHLIETTGKERQGPTGRMCRVWRVV